MRTSSIRLRANARLAILHEDFLEICDGNMLAAMLLSILVYWTDVKIAKKDENLWIWKSHEDFQEDLMFDKPGMKPPHRTTIKAALDLLVSKNFLQWRRNPKMPLDQTRQYLAEQKAIQTAIDALPSIVVKPTMESQNIDNALSIDQQSLSENQQCNDGIPTSNTNDYSTEITNPEITEQREREVAHATARSHSSSQNDSGEDTEKREAVKVGTPVQEVTQANTNAVQQPPAPRKPRSNPTIPKRPRPQQQELTDEIPAGAHSKPVEPHAEMTWGTRKCLQWFDYWRGGTLIAKWKLQQAASFAKGLAEQFDEKTVVEIYGDMAKDPYYIERGGPDIGDVANNIHKYLNKKKPKKEPSNEHKATQQPANAFIERCLDKDYNKKKLEWMREENARRRQAQAEGVQ